MLTDKEMQQIAERYIEKLGKESNIEMMLFSSEIIKKKYGNIYYFDSKEYIINGDIGKALVGNGPFLVEKDNGRLVNFGTTPGLDEYLIAYENDILPEVSDRYWYSDEDRYDSK